MAAPGTTALTSTTELLTRVSSMYYLEDMTQEEIATHLKLSRPKVGRLLRQARREGIVEIKVNMHPSLAMPVETELVQRFGLTQAIVVGDQSDEDEQRARVGAAAVELLDRLVRDDTTITVGMGRNVRAVSQQASGLRPRACTVVSGIGGSPLTGEGLNSNDIAGQLADALGGKSVGMFAPAYAKSGEQRDTFAGHLDVGRTIEQARAADIAVVGIGDANTDSLVVRLGCITAKEMSRLLDAGAVGDILGSFFTVDGDPSAKWIEERVVGLTLDDLRSITQVIAVASENSKAPAILGALRSGLVHTLVTSVNTARAVMELADKNG
ncbi:sugar-binding transcriptional regulator [Jiangella anatolica]|uniref:Sugar-binding domain-containing protein n=1 Tax=Jiangella anatolica TaxID=2670374 RepID=A0A2W2CBD2_9ACTN|nr:sugar-binding transcriptional regulator [Jiangella anatolica]PZF85587.1 hypothetical protein C1I92_04255 [Jiangella anatolica]